MTAPIRKVEVGPEGIVVTLEDGSRRRMAFDLIEAADIASVHVAEGRDSIVIRLRSGDPLEWDVSHMMEV